MQRRSDVCRYCGHRVIDVDGVMKHLKFTSDSTPIIVSRVCQVRFPANGGVPCGCPQPEKLEKNEKRESVFTGLRRLWRRRSP